MNHASPEELSAGLAGVREAPADAGSVEMIVRRTGTDRREVLDEAVLDPALGLVGDDWPERWSEGTVDGSPNPLAQLTLMNSRVAALLAGRDRWALSGDQLFVELDLSVDNLPPGTRLAVGEAVIEMSPEPHTGCGKFTRRFGLAALRWTKTEEGRRLRLRGAYATVVSGGVVRRGDAIRKLDEA